VYNILAEPKKEARGKWTKSCKKIGGFVEKREILRREDFSLIDKVSGVSGFSPRLHAAGSPR
jgi:hypothetical protein